jgi:hypothetical protein
MSENESEYDSSNDSMQRLKKYEKLDEIGNVYLKYAPRDMYTASELMIMTGKVDSDWFSFKKYPMMPSDAFYNVDKRKNYLIRLSKQLSKAHKQISGRRSERKKTYRSTSECVEGISSTGCIYHVDYCQSFVLPYIENNPVPILVRFNPTC